MISIKNPSLITRALVLIAALIAGPLSAQSIATEANKELPDWLQIGGLDRARFEGFLDRNFTHDANDVHFLNRLRINLTVRATSWMRLVLEGQDARIYFNRSVPNAPRLPIDGCSTPPESHRFKPSRCAFGPGGYRFRPLPRALGLEELVHGTREEAATASEITLRPH